MNKKELGDAIRKIEEKARKEKVKAVIDYCKSNNTYAVGDKFHDHFGTIIIESIGYTSRGDDYFCTYTGLNLTKSGTVSKRTPRRTAYQSNEVLK